MTVFEIIRNQIDKIQMENNSLSDIEAAQILKQPIGRCNRKTLTCHTTNPQKH